MARETKTISIQPDLNARMAKFPNENWSAVACRAFEIRLVELESMKTSNLEEKAAARLKASKMRATDKLFREGETAGIRHVLQHADFLELERLDDSNQRDTLDLESEECSFSGLALVMTGGDNQSACAIESLLRRNCGSDIDRPEWLQGFVAGATKKFEELRSKID